MNKLDVRDCMSNAIMLVIQYFIGELELYPAPCFCIRNVYGLYVRVVHPECSLHSYLVEFMAKIQNVLYAVLALQIVTADQAEHVLFEVKIDRVFKKNQFSSDKERVQSIRQLILDLRKTNVKPVGNVAWKFKILTNGFEEAEQSSPTPNDFKQSYKKQTPPKSPKRPAQIKFKIQEFGLSLSFFFF